MYSIWAYGSTEQKDEWLPRLAAGEAIGCFGLTEPDFGSNPAGMRTRATRDGSDWILSGTKMWITNGSIADVATVWARTEDGIRGFLVPRGTPGFTSSDVPHKLSLRASTTSAAGVRRGAAAGRRDAARSAGLRGPLGCLNEARFGIVFGALGAARDCLETTLDYASTRVQFDRPIAGFQLTQAKFADMAVELAKGLVLAVRLGRLKDDGRLRPEQLSVGQAQQHPRGDHDRADLPHDSRGSGITLDYPALRHANNLEAGPDLRGDERGAPADDRAGADRHLGVPVTRSTPSVARRVLEAAGAVGVRHVFGLPGVHNLAFWRETGAELPRIIGVRHEQTTVYAADGLARATGGLGVALTTTGPGAANAVGAFGEAAASGSPVLLIASEISTAPGPSGSARGVLHESRDQAALFEPLAKAVFRPRTVDAVVRDIGRAIATALACPRGPGLPRHPDRSARRSRRRPVAIERARTAGGARPADIDRARRPRSRPPSRIVIWVGGGAVQSGRGRRGRASSPRRCRPAWSPRIAARGILPPGHPSLVGPAAARARGRRADRRRRPDDRARHRVRRA